MIYADARDAIKRKKQPRGFTIVELTIVIIVIGILAAITIVGYSGMSQSAKARAVGSEAQRMATELRKYKVANGVYPSDLSSISQTAGYTYGYAKYDSNSLCVSATKDNISYYVLSSNTEPQSGTCAGASGGASAPSGLVATANSTTQITLNWTAPTSFTPANYTVQYSTSNSFTSSSSISNVTGTSRAIGSLSPSTQYYFRVQANTSQGGRAYSSTISGATYTDWSVYTRLTGVGDWNNDGDNDIVGYKSNGNIDLHLGNGNSSFGPAIYLENIGTGVQAITGLGKIRGNSTVMLWWWQTPSNNASIVRSDGNIGVSGGIQSVTPTGWSVTNAASFAPGLMSNGTPVIIAKYTNGSSPDLKYWSPDANGNSTDVSYASNTGWQTMFPGTNRVFGAGDWSGDGIGDVIGIKSDGTMCLYTGDGAGAWKAGSSCGVVIGSGWVNDNATGGWDYSGDGRPDILRYYIPSNVLYVYTNNGASGFGTTYTVH